jgi:hypothetical protein
MIEGFCGRVTVAAVGSAGKRVVSDRLGISFACNGGVTAKWRWVEVSCMRPDLFGKLE